MLEPLPVHFATTLPNGWAGSSRSCWITTPQGSRSAEELGFPSSASAHVVWGRPFLVREGRVHFLSSNLQHVGNEHELWVSLRIPLVSIADTELVCDGSIGRLCVETCGKHKNAPGGVLLTRYWNRGEGMSPVVTLELENDQVGELSMKHGSRLRFFNINYRLCLSWVTAVPPRWLSEDG